MIAIGTVIIEAFACFGLGAMILRALNVDQWLTRYEAAAIAFALGFGSLGWLLFLIGMVGGFSAIPLLLLLVVAGTGMVCLRGLGKQHIGSGSLSRLGVIEGLLTAGIAAALLCDLLEGLSPPVDADTLAYHFTHAKHFLSISGLEFIPRAVDGAIPMLVQMTYVPALALGGERALTLWTMLSGWAAAGLVYATARRFLKRRWALSVTLVFLTTPAVIYSAGSGQVEIRNALFVLMAAFALSHALRTGSIGFAVLAGLGAGFFMGSKYLGLLFALSCGIVILFQRRWLSHGLTFAIIAFAAGCQWYAWNWFHTGDPIFPVLFPLFDSATYPYWDQTHYDAFQKMKALDTSLPINIISYFTYPFIATVNGKIFEAARTGLGPLLLIALPFALAGGWACHRKIPSHLLLPFIVLAALFYTFWFFTGSSQRVRHMLPLYPLILISLSTAAVHGAVAVRSHTPLAVAFTLTIALQLSAHMIFTRVYAQYVFGGGDREIFLTRTVSGYTPVPWINRNLDKSDKILVEARQLIYLFDLPVFYAHWGLETRIDTSPSARNLRRFARQLKRQGITHILAMGSLPDKRRYDMIAASGFGLWHILFTKGCLDLVKSLKGPVFASRTLKTSVRTAEFHIFKLKPFSCLTNDKDTKP